eukprot:s899_g15.t1
MESSVCGNRERAKRADIAGERRDLDLWGFVIGQELMEPSNPPTPPGRQPLLFFGLATAGGAFDPRDLAGPTPEGEGGPGAFVEAIEYAGATGPFGLACCDNEEAACERLPFAEGFLKYAAAPQQPAECQRQLERLGGVWTLEYRQELECLKWAKTYQSYERPDFVMWYLLGVRMFYLTAPKAYRSDRLTWPWWQSDEEFLLEAPTALPKDALLALVLMDEVRKAQGNVGEEFLSFLRDALSSWNATLLAQLFDVDAMTELLRFLLDSSTPPEEEEAAAPGIYLTEFLCTLENLLDRGVMEVAVGTTETLKPFAEYYASRGEPDFTTDRIKVYEAEPDELHERQVVPMFNMVALVEHVDFLQANLAAKVAVTTISQLALQQLKG